MKQANETNFFAAYDDLKKNYHCKSHNIFMDSKELGRKISSQICHFHETPRSVFLLCPSHGDMQEMYFVSADPKSFSVDLPYFMSYVDQFSSVKISVIGKDDSCMPIVSALKDNGFAIVKKLLRMRLGAPDDKFISAMRLLASDYINMASFACEDDADEILSIICEEFDIVGDNIPSLNEIRENISKRNVTVVRINNVIASVHYFMVENGISHGYFDITRKEFRGGNGLFFALNLFEHDYFKSNNIKINRSYGWRDAAKTRLVKSSNKTSSFPDGVVIYNMIWKRNRDSENTGEMHS